MTDDKLTAARNSFSGKSMTEGQLKEALAITNILHAEIHRSGSFIEKLTDYGHAFARNEKFDAMRSEKMLRDVYTAAQGQTMNQTREALIAREEALKETQDPAVMVHANQVERLIQEGPTQPFYKAYDQAAISLAEKLGVTQNGAKLMMKDVYQTAHGRSLYEDGKKLEEAYHKPVREAEIAARKAEQLPTRSQTQSYT